MKTNHMLVVGGAVLVAAGLALSEEKSAQSARPGLTNSHKARTAGPARSVKSAADLPVIGYLKGRDHMITIKAGPKGPLYSVTTADGKVLYENVSREQLSAKAPELGEFLKTAVASPAGAAGTNKADARLRPVLDASILGSAAR